MSKNRIRFYAILAILLLLFSVVVFVAPLERGQAFWLSYVFTVFAVILVAISWTKAFADRSARSRVYGFPLARLCTIYLVVQVLFAAFCILAPNALPVWMIGIIDVVLLGITIVGLVTTDAVRDEVERQETVTQRSTAAMMDLRVKAESIARSCTDPVKRQELETLAESIRFSDPVSGKATEELERKLSFLLDELKETGDTALIGRIETVLEERNQLCKAHKM